MSAEELPISPKSLWQPSISHPSTMHGTYPSTISLSYGAGWGHRDCSSFGNSNPLPATRPTSRAQSRRTGLPARASQWHAGRSSLGKAT